MTHQNEYTFASELAEKGLEAVPELLRVLINNAMQVERSKYLQAEKYERTEERKGHGNGYKPKTVKTRIGEITFAVPQVREGGFYPSALEKGLRSERALVSTLAEGFTAFDFPLEHPKNLFEPPTAWRGSIKRSAGARESLVLSQTRLHASGWSLLS